MICKTCGMDLTQKKFTSYTYLGERSWTDQCILCDRLLREHSAEIVRETNRYVHKGHGIVFVHKYDFGECARRWQIPMSFDQFFDEHPDGKIEIAISDYDTYPVEGVYV